MSNNLTLEELKQQNPALYAQCMTAGVAEGVAQERKRIVALLPRHVTNAISKYAIQNIKDGSPMGDMQKARYWSMQINAQRRTRKQAADAEYIVAGIEKRFGVNCDDHNNH